MRNSMWMTGAAVAITAGMASAARAAVVGQVDTFTDGTTAGWAGGASPTNVATGGPLGAGDRWLKITSTGSFGGGSKLIAYNRGQWVGTYAGITTVGVDLLDAGTGPLSVRIAFKDGIGSIAGGYASSTPFALPADGNWHHATFALTDAAFTPVNGPAESFASLLGGPAEFRILSSAAPALDGDAVAASLGIDNLAAGGTAVPEPATMSLAAVAALLAGRRQRR